MKVVFTQQATRQLGNLYEFIADQAGESVADAYVGRVVAYCESFALFSQRGRCPGLRTVGFERRATIAYFIDAQKLVIEGIFPGGQDWEKALNPTYRNK